MKKDFGLNTVDLGVMAVEFFIITKLYPTDTPDFKVSVVGFTGLTEDEDWRGCFSTNLPDDMLYEVVKRRNQEELTVTAYKKEDL